MLVITQISMLVILTLLGMDHGYSVTFCAMFACQIHIMIVKSSHDG